MDLVVGLMVVAFVASTVYERRRYRRLEYAILDTQQIIADLTLAENMEAAGFEVVEVNVNERGQALRDNAEWN